MRSFIALAIAALGANAFENTSPIVAWSGAESSVLGALDTSKWERPSVFKGDKQAPFAQRECTFDSLLVATVPGLHASDLALLSTTTRESIAQAQTLVENDFVPTTRATRRQAAEAIREIYETAAACGASSTSLSFDGLEHAHDRLDILSMLDMKIAHYLSNSTGSHAVVLTGIEHTHSHHKRQLDVTDWTDVGDAEVNEGEVTAMQSSTATSSAATSTDATSTPSDATSTSTSSSTTTSSSSEATSPTSTSMPSEPTSSNDTKSSYTPKSTDGLFYHYSFLSPILVFAILLVALVLLPAMLLSTSALGSIETLQGLETKMKGSTGIDQQKSASN